MPRKKGAFFCYLAGELRHNRLQTRNRAQFRDDVYFIDVRLFQNRQYPSKMNINPKIV